MYHYIHMYDRITLEFYYHDDTRLHSLIFENSYLRRGLNLRGVGRGCETGSFCVVSLQRFQTGIPSLKSSNSSKFYPKGPIQIPGIYECNYKLLGYCIGYEFCCGTVDIVLNQKITNIHGDLKAFLFDDADKERFTSWDFWDQLFSVPGNTDTEKELRGDERARESVREGWQKE
ncbi:hypothetical protein LSTR_LSTR014293 [Laodelphax striatellus]|uniref:Uncharacterized protein n=1 Tax=Laodelphax striatellus TaxID=195883 RepID=A0A482WYT4_LAOST|nr:hypothetical protein LSTR_LSTR014293 [Laodelphax striatellus]